MGKQKFILMQFILVLNVFVNRSKTFAYEAPSSCKNPNNRFGLCISVYDCPSILNSIQVKRSANFEFVRKSECVSSNDQGLRPYVCCTSDTGFSTRNDYTGRIVFPDEFDENIRMKNDKSTTVKTFDSSVFPKPPFCGPIVIGNKIFGGEEAEWGEFPWLVNLEYRTPSGGLTSACAGNILNHKYILTAAHCVQGDIEEKVGQLVSVRVGVHNTQAPIGCTNNECLERLSVAERIVHTGFISYDGYHNHHDIALLRTDRNMQYSTTVAPVCLTNVFTETPQLKNGTKLSVAGWGHTGATKVSPVKRKVELPYVESEGCSIKVAPEQLCAGGEFYKDTCNGDSGGGLVRWVKDAWIIEGLVSYGSGCGLEKPGVYTRVSSYISWIEANVKP